MPSRTASRSSNRIARPARVCISTIQRMYTLFSDDALVVIHQASRGLPRAINNLALQSLVATFSAKKSIVDQSAAKMAVVEVVDD